jgi:hypothetical protein
LGLGREGCLQVVGVVFGEAVAVYQVGARGMVAERTCVIADLVFGIDQVSSRQAHLRSLPRSPGVYIHSRGLEVSWKPWDRRPVRSIATRRRGIVDPTSGLGEARRVVTRPGAEVGRLVHVDPERVDIQTAGLVEEQRKLVGPERLRGSPKPVGIDCWSGPDNALVDRAVAVREEGSGFSSSIVGVVVLVRISFS